MFHSVFEKDQYSNPVTIDTLTNLLPSLWISENISWSVMVLVDNNTAVRAVIIRALDDVSSSVRPV